ncbi:hypothetical protein [Haliangium ochraceum]|uniref:Uncharacterized protein n=1 Tax=Haliangium ochraceum (strain DSM 14365 / JCM 11303 / SMP-2) TaxID=502025 RepID=D0LW77_HALO1|nr:hypothetical protein [Haliangium ochraceum]ACY16009.1 hypothetical protein Hoch_3507 [Haliangium ochraceum DSM 14365]
MPDYSRIHELVSHRLNVEYDTGARIVGYLASCLPGSGPVEFIKLTSVELIDSAGRVVQRLPELMISPNLLTGLHIDEGPRGRDHNTSKA